MAAKTNNYVGIIFIIIGIVIYLNSPKFMIRYPIEHVVLEKVKSDQYKLNDTQNREIKRLAEYAISANKQNFYDFYFIFFIITGSFLIVLGLIQKKHIMRPLHNSNDE